MVKVKYTDLLDYIVRLLKEAKEMDPTGFISLTAFLNLVKYKHSFNEALEIGKYLETVGWAKASYLIGDVRLQITTGGIIYIESKGGEFEVAYNQYIDDVLKDYSADSAPFIKLLNEHNSIDPKATIVTLIDTIEKKMLEAKMNEDVIKDIQVIKIEISKTQPDLRMIENKLNVLTSFNQISDEISQLKDYVQIHQHF